MQRYSSLGSYYESLICWLEVGCGASYIALVEGLQVNIANNYSRPLHSGKSARRSGSPTVQGFGFKSRA